VTCYSTGEVFESVCQRLGIKLSQELNMTYDSRLLSSSSEFLTKGIDSRDPLIARNLRERGIFTLHEGKTFWHYNDVWGDRPRHLIEIRNFFDKKDWLLGARFFRLAFRDVSSSTNERTLVFCLFPPCIFGNTAPTEKNADQRSNASALILMGLCNTFLADWMVRVKTATHVNLFILKGIRLPPYAPFALFVCHSALRLISNHLGYELLWKEQLGENWREVGSIPSSFPVVREDDARWEIRAAVDAVVASAYGLNRDLYEHVLASFNHKNYPDAPELCLACFDELKEIGLEAFTRKRDPYWDIPLNEGLPKPVIDDPAPDSLGVSSCSSSGKNPRNRSGKNRDLPL
jgi:hypothetical protein